PTSAAAPAAAAQPAGAPIRLDPFFEVRTPARNYGPAKLPGGVAVTPLARRLALDAGIDLTRVKGPGPHGRGAAREVEAAAGPGRPARPVAPAAPPAPAASAAAVMALYRDTPFEEVPLDGMRRTIAARLL